MRENATEGDAHSVWHAIDDFSRANFLMNVGDAKGDIVEEEIAAAKPKVGNSRCSGSTTHFPSC